MLSDSNQDTQIADGLHMGDNVWLCAWMNQLNCSVNPSVNQRGDSARDALTKPQ